ncbi:MAG: ribosomal RNA large subunit methyltransferase E [Porticoccaceae bacterium]|nr:MAG: ribosomal RNA large subunit methyltransferase E [Porticoccaceae bacterium]
MARSRSSARWLKEHQRDPYVQRSRAEGYRSRASYKLLELDRRDRLFAPGQRVVDLGAAPGGWTQVAVERVGPKGRVVALDLLPMAPVPGAVVLRGDFTEEAVFELLLAALEGEAVDLVLSDMAPNMSGVKAVDQPRALLLAELAADFARRTLRPGGALVVKVFQGEGFDALLRDLRRHFAAVATRKPEASRARSAELYLVARGFRAP